jgi:hypothetical protein
VNKNVDWINHIYYNQHRFVNYARDAVNGTTEQLGPTNDMEWENQTSLDMILVEKGGICVPTWGQVLHIPNSTALDGTVTKALQGLTALPNNWLRTQG